MGNVARAVLTPLSIIDKDLARIALQVVAVVAMFIPGGQPVAAAAALILAVLYRPKAPKPPTTQGSLKTSLPPRVRAYGRGRLYGAYVLFETSSTGRAIDIFAVHDGRIDGIEKRYLGDEVITLDVGGHVNELDGGAYGGDNVNWHETLGTDPGTANWPDIVSRLPGIWTNDHRGDGVVMLATRWQPVKSKNFQKIYPQGGPVPASIAARWQWVFDWRDVTQSVDDPMTWKWSENAVLHLAHYRLVVEKSRGSPDEVLPSGAVLQATWDTFFAPTLAYWTAAADVCDENVALKAGGTEKRYRSCLAHKMTDPHKEVIDGLLSCFDGWAGFRADGALTVFAGKYYEPTLTIGPDEIVSYSWQHGVEDESAINEIIVSYVSGEHEYNTVEATPWRDVDDILNRGNTRSFPLDLQIPSHAQARRLAKRTMARVMAPDRGVVTTNIAGRAARGERYINLVLEEAGTVFFDGPAEVVELTRNLSTGGVTFSWVAADPNIDAWNPATEEGDPATVGPRVAGAPLDTPTVDSAAAVYVSSGQGTTGVRIQVLATGPADRDDLTWFMRWRVVGAAVWNEQRYDDLDPGATVELLSGLVPVGEDLEVEVAYAVGDGRVSDYSTPPTAVSSDTESVAPAAATAITLIQWADSLDLSTDVIARASTYRWRFYASDGTTLIRTIVTTTRTVSYSRTLAAGDGAERAYIVDVAGVNSAGAGTVAVSGLLTKPAPAAVTGFSIADDPTTAAAVFTPLTGGVAAGYMFYYSNVSGFDPLEEGIVVRGFGSPIYAYNLGVDTYYGKVAAYDEWSARPDLLNFTAEDTFDITTGGGSFGGGSGTGSGGGGYCVTTDTPILLADGTEKPAGDIVVGDVVRTQHETTMEWGDYPVVAAETVASTDVWEALGIRATGGHRVWIDGWVHMRDIGAPSDPADVVRLTVADAHTYYSRGILSHNIKETDYL